MVGTLFARARVSNVFLIVAWPSPRWLSVRFHFQCAYVCVICKRGRVEGWDGMQSVRQLGKKSIFYNCAQLERNL